MADLIAAMADQRFLTKAVALKAVAAPAPAPAAKTASCGLVAPCGYQIDQSAAPLHAAITSYAKTHGCSFEQAIGQMTSTNKRAMALAKS